MPLKANGDYLRKLIFVFIMMGSMCAAAGCLCCGWVNCMCALHQSCVYGERPCYTFSNSSSHPVTSSGPCIPPHASIGSITIRVPIADKIGSTFFCLLWSLIYLQKLLLMCDSLDSCYFAVFRAILGISHLVVWNLQSKACRAGHEPEETRWPYCLTPLPSVWTLAPGYEWKPEWWIKNKFKSIKQALTCRDLPICSHVWFLFSVTPVQQFYLLLSKDSSYWLFHKCYKS